VTTLALLADDVHSDLRLPADPVKLEK